MKLFIVAPLNDKLTKGTTLVWAENAVKFAAMQGVSAITLLGGSATRQMVEGMLREYHGEPGLFCFFDHGAEGCLWDAQHQPMIDHDNIGLLKNKFVYAVACRAAAGLGPIALEHGVAGFLGFSEKVRLFLRRDFPRLAGRFLVSGLITLLRDAGNAGQAEAFMRAQFEAIMAALALRTDISPLEQLILADVFRHNHDYLTLLGDKNWVWKT